MMVGDLSLMLCIRSTHASKTHPHRYVTGRRVHDFAVPYTVALLFSDILFPLIASFNVLRA